MFDHANENGADQKAVATSVAITKPWTKASQLDVPKAIRLHGMLLSYYEQELDRQYSNRIEQAIDHDFYDNDQWSDEDKAILKARGQHPTVYNIIASTINWVIGSEKRGRSDYRILPRRADASKAAERKTQLMKYNADVNHSQFHKSRAFEDAVKGGIGWIECGTQDDDDGEPVYDRYESWRNILWDSSATEMDLSDARYMIRAKWVDEDLLSALFPDRREIVRRSAVTSADFSTETEYGDEAMDSQEQTLDVVGHATNSAEFSRNRVRAIEVWFRAPVQKKRLRGGDFSGDVYEPGSGAHFAAVQSGQSVLVDKVTMRMHVAILTTDGLLYVSESPYRHNQFPFTPIWCYRRSRDGLPYGMVRGMRGMQEDINKKISKIQWILASNKIVMEEDAVPDLDELAEEAARPDGIIVHKANKRLELNVDRGLDAAHMALLSMSVDMIQRQSGVTDENLGRKTNAVSGVAIQSRQDQGGMTTTGPFDNLRFSSQIHGAKVLSLIEQNYNEAKSFRITNMRGTPEYVTINDGMPENDIINTKSDFVISEQDWRATVRQANVEQLIELVMKLAPVNPQLGLVMLDLIVEGMDIPSREELVRRIRQITGMSDPDADEPSPEEIAKAQEAAEQAAMAKAMAQAEIADKEASARAKGAQAAKADADTQAVLASIAGTNVASQKAALEAALAILSAPPVVPIADAVLHEAGFVSRTEQEDVADATDRLAAEAAAEQAAMAPPPQPAPMPQQQAANQPNPMPDVA